MRQCERHATVSNDESFSFGHACELYRLLRVWRTAYVAPNFKQVARITSDVWSAFRIILIVFVLGNVVGMGWLLCILWDDSFAEANLEVALRNADVH